MSRIAVQGDPGGLGIVTVKAPNTEDSYALELPPSGGTLARAAAGGMPMLDDGTPVVESGSNTDGEWWRSADGTQIAHVVTTSSSSGNTTWTYPQPFIERPALTGTAMTNTTVPIVVNFTNTNTDAISASYSAYRASDDARIDATLGAAAHGRWK